MTRIAISLICALGLAARSQAADNWPQWRGPDFNGSSDSTHLPVSWSPTKNIRWKTPLPSFGAATPAIWGDRIFVLSGSPPDGKSGPTTKAAAQDDNIRADRAPGEGRDLLLLCISRKDGAILWTRKLDEANRHYNKQNMASPSPATDGRMVWAMTGAGTLSAFDVDGKFIWRHELQKEYGPFGFDFGYASTPLLWDGKLIVQALYGSDTENLGYIVAYQADTGKLIWKISRPSDAIDETWDCYSSPTILRRDSGVELIIGGADYVTAHDPANGKEIWRCGGMNLEKNPRYRAVSSPVVAGQTVFMSARQGPMVACKSGGHGDITATHTLWTNPTAPDVPTPVCDADNIYILHDAGRLSCLDLKTGEPRYLKQPLPVGTYSASPLLADGKLYVTSEGAHTTVLAAGPEFKILAENQLDDAHALSSIAVAGRELFLRGGKYLYCISEQNRDR